MWSAADYASNSVVQQTWARELIAELKLRGDEHILDVGCGDGKVTAEIARAVPHGSVVGVDASPQMIEFAKKTFSAAKIPNLEFHVMDARKIQFVRKFDFVFSNAALHWVDDHQAFLRGAASVLKPGGRLMVSCGGKGNAHDVFLALRPEMRLKRWREFFRKMRSAVFFPQPGGIQKMAAAIWIQNAQRQARAEGCDLSGRRRICDLAAHDVDALHAARAGKYARGIHRCRRRAIRRETSGRMRRARSTSAWCGWKLMRVRNFRDATKMKILLF